MRRVDDSVDLSLRERLVPLLGLGEPAAERLVLLPKGLVLLVGVFGGGGLRRHGTTPSARSTASWLLRFPTTRRTGGGARGKSVGEGPKPAASPRRGSRRRSTISISTGWPET